MVAMHHHVCECFAKNIVLALVRCRKSIVLNMNRSVNKSAEAAQNNLNSLPNIVLLGNTVSISYLRLLDCRTRNLNIVNAKRGNIPQDIRSFAEHQKPGISEQSITGDVDLFAKFSIINLPEISKILCLAEGESITFQGIEIKHLNTCVGNGLLCLLAERLVAEHRTDFALSSSLIATAHTDESIDGIVIVHRLKVYLRDIEGKQLLSINSITLRRNCQPLIELLTTKCSEKILFKFFYIVNSLYLECLAGLFYAEHNPATGGV